MSSRNFKTIHCSLHNFAFDWGCKTEEFAVENYLMFHNGIKSITQRLFWHFSNKCGVSLSESKPSASSQQPLTFEEYIKKSAVANPCADHGD